MGCIIKTDAIELINEYVPTRVNSDINVRKLPDLSKQKFVQSTIQTRHSRNKNEKNSEMRVQGNGTLN